MSITVKIMATDSTVTALSVAISVTLMCTSLSQHCCNNCRHNAVLVFATTALSQQCQVAFAVTLMCTSLSHHSPLPLLSQRCHCQCCNITISTITARMLCSFSLSQRCHSNVSCLRCHTNVHSVISALSATTAVTTLSLSVL